MTLKTAARIQWVAAFLLWLITLPFVIIDVVLECCRKPFEWIIIGREKIKFLIGNRLMLLSDEAKNGTIQNKDILRSGTAIFAYEKLHQEMKCNRDYDAEYLQHLDKHLQQEELSHTEYLD